MPIVPEHALSRAPFVYIMVNLSVFMDLVPFDGTFIGSQSTLADLPCMEMALKLPVIVFGKQY
jgi:hypothetical protein